VDAILTDYFAAWNETDARERGQLLRGSLSDDAGFQRIVMFHGPLPTGD
jgi:hypothetical protein